MSRTNSYHSFFTHCHSSSRVNSANMLYQLTGRNLKPATKKGLMG